MGLASRASVARIGVGQVEGQQAQQGQAAGVELVLRFFHAQLLGGDIGFGLHDLELGHAPSADQRLVDLQQGVGALQRVLDDAQLLLGAQQLAVGGDDLADGLCHGGLEVQAVGLFRQARQAQRRGGRVPAGAAHQRWMSARSRPSLR